MELRSSYLVEADRPTANHTAFETKLTSSNGLTYSLARYTF
jgi:hypothetical protein